MQFCIYLVLKQSCIVHPALSVVYIVVHSRTWWTQRYLVLFFRFHYITVKVSLKLINNLKKIIYLHTFYRMRGRQRQSHVMRTMPYNPDIPLSFFFYSSYLSYGFILWSCSWENNAPNHIFCFQYDNTQDAICWHYLELNVWKILNSRNNTRFFKKNIYWRPIIQ